MPCGWGFCFTLIILKNYTFSIDGLREVSMAHASVLDAYFLIKSKFPHNQVFFVRAF